MIGHRVALRPRSFLEIADLTIVFMRRHASAFVKLAPWVLVPAALGWWLHRWEEWPPEAAFAVEVLALSFTQGVYTQLCGDLMLVPSVRARTIQWKFLTRLGAWLAAWCVSWLATCMVVLYRAAVFAPEGVFLERGRLFPTMSRHSRLVGVTPGRAMGFAASTVLAWMGGAFAVGLLRLGVREMFALKVDFQVDALDRLNWAPFLGIALVQPYLTALRFLFYIDCRTRREGWDLQREFAALAAPDAPAEQEAA